MRLSFRKAMSTQNRTSPASGAARRKLLRGAFALPAVMTVHSGSALAASSSLRCLANGPTQASAPSVIRHNEVETPQYVRTELAVASKTADGETSYRYFVDGAGLYTLALARGADVHSSLISSTGYLRFRVGVNNSNYNKITGTELTRVAVESDGWALVADPPNGRRRYAVVMFDSTGETIVGVGGSVVVGEGVDAHAATESCWTSFGV